MGGHSFTYDFFFSSKWLHKKTTVYFKLDWVKIKQAFKKSEIVKMPLIKKSSKNILGSHSFAKTFQKSGGRHFSHFLGPKDSKKSKFSHIDGRLPMPTTDSNL